MMISQKVLFVDDEESILNALQFEFRNFSYDLHYCNSGNEALQLMYSTDFALVVSDLKMPEMDGFQLLGKIYESFPNTSRMVLTGYSHLNLVLKAISLGQIQRYLLKPWNFQEDIIPAVEHGLQRYRLIQQRQIDQTTLLEKKQELKDLLKTTELFKSKIEVSNQNKTEIIRFFSNNITPFISEIIDLGFRADLICEGDQISDLEQLGKRGMEILSLLIKIKAMVKE